MRYLNLYRVLILLNGTLAVNTYALDNAGLIIDQNVLNTKATLLTSINNINDLKKIAFDNFNVNLTIKGRVVDNKKIYLDRSNVSLQDLLNYVQTYYKYKWYTVNNQIIIDTLIDDSANTTGGYQVWSVSISDKNLRGVLKRWCSDSGWSLVWNAKYDYLVDVDWQINGSFEDAVNKILKASNLGDKKLSAIMYSDNKVLVINSR